MEQRINNKEPITKDSRQNKERKYITKIQKQTKSNEPRATNAKRRATNN